MPKTCKKSKKAKIVRTYNLRSRARKLEEIPASKDCDLVTESLQANEIALKEFITQPLQLDEVITLMQSGLLNINEDNTDKVVVQRETAGSPIRDIAENMYKTALAVHFEQKALSKHFPNEEELPTAWEDITNLKLSIIFEYSAYKLDDLLDDEEAKNAASCKFFKARCTTPRVTKKRTNLNKNDPNVE